MRSQKGRGAFAWATLAPALAFGQAVSGTLALRWSDPSNLSPSSSAEFEARLADRLGRPAFDAESASGRTLAVTWQGTPEQCRIELMLVRGGQVEGTRQLESPSGDCKSLAPALLTVSALLIESTRPEPAGSPEPTPPVPPRPAPPPDKAEEPEPANTDRVPLALFSLGGQLASGLAPRVELGPAAALVFSPVRYLRVGASGAYYVPHEHGSRPGFELGHAAVSALACGMPLNGSLSLGLCGSGTLHRFVSAGVSLPHANSTQTFSWSLGLSARAEWRLIKSLWWVGSLGADVTPQPLYFYFTPAPGGESILFRQERLSPYLFLGLTLEVG